MPIAGSATATTPAMTPKTAGSTQLNGKEVQADGTTEIIEITEITESVSATGAARGPEVYVHHAIDDIDKRMTYLRQQIAGLQAMENEFRTLGGQRHLLANTLQQLQAPLTASSASAQKTWAEPPAALPAL